LLPWFALIFGAGEMVSLTFAAVTVTTVPAVVDGGTTATDPTDGEPPMYIFISVE
jgi:hypothetical protein